MPDKKITDLVDGAPLQPTDEFVVARAGDNFKIDGAEVVSAVTKHDVTLSGNTAGALAAISSGTWTLAGGNNITLSQAGNAVTISGAAAGGAQTAISGISASDTLYTSGTVRFTGVGGGVTVSSNTGQRVDISVAAPVAQTVQTQNVVDLTLDGNTAGVLALVSSGTATLAGGNNITLSQAGNAITISGANVGGAQTGISSIANSQTTYTAGAVTLSELGAITIRSTTGSHFQFSVNPQSVQPETQTFIGGISASNTLYTSGSVRFTGSQAVTVRSGTGQLVVIDAPAQSVQPETQTFIAGISASDTLYTSGNVRITGVGGGVTVSSNTGQRVDISVAAPVAATNLSVGVSTGGNTAGNTTVNTGSRFVIVGSNGITASQGTAAGATTVTLSGVTQSVQTQGVLSAGVSTGGNTAGNTTVNTGSRFVLVASGNATASQATAAGASTVTISVGTQTVQTQNVHNVTLSGNSTSAGAGFIEISSGTLTLAGGNNVTLSQNGNAVTISGANVGGAQTAISGIANSQTTYTSGTVSLSELGAITIRSTTGQQFQISVNSQTVQTQGILSAGVSTGGNTAGNTTVNTGSRLVFVGTNNITLSQGTAAGATTVTVSGPTTAAQTVQTQGILNVALSNIGNTAGDTGINSGTRYVLAGGNNVTLSASSAANATTVTISAAAQTVQTQGILSAGVSNVGNTSGNTTVNTGSRLVLAGGNNITLSQSTAAGATTITVSAPNLGAGAMSAGVSNLGNSAGATGITGTQLVLVGSDNITLSQTTGANGGTVSIIGGGGGGFSAGVSTGGNTAGDTGVTGTRMVFVGNSPMSLSQATAAAGGTISINAPATSSLSATGNIQISTNGSTISIGDGALTLDFVDNIVGSSTTFQHSDAALNIYPLNPANKVFPGHMSVLTMFLDMSGTVSTAAAFTRSLSLGFYTRVNSTQLSLLYSASTSWGTNAGNMNINDTMGGRRWVTFHSSQFNAAPNFLYGSDYFVGFWHRSSGGSQTFAYQGALLPFATGLRSGFMSVASATNTTNAHFPFLGNYSVSFTTGMPAALAASDVNKSNATAISLPRLIFNNVGTNII